MTDRTAPSSDARKRNAERVYRHRLADFIETRLPDPSPTTPDQEGDPMTKHDRHDELVALLTEIRDRLPGPKREEAFVEMHPAVVGHNLRHWKPGPHTAGVDCPCGPEKVPHERAPREDEDVPDSATRSQALAWRKLTQHPSVVNVRPGGPRSYLDNMLDRLTELQKAEDERDEWKARHEALRADVEAWSTDKRDWMHARHRRAILDRDDERAKGERR